MAVPQFVVDRDSVASSFREWQEEQQRLDAQLAESVAALDAYQSHLDNWQQELVREREELRRLRAELESGNPAPTAEIESSRAEIARLQSDLDAAQAREQESNSALAAQRLPAEDRATLPHDALDAAIEQAASSTNQGDSSNGGSGRAESRRRASPVLGSVMEQFGKLREQRSLNRSNNKTR